MIIVDAKAGSGKTLLALSGAIKKVRKKQYQKIIYIRNSIESLDKGEDVGGKTYLDLKKSLPSIIILW